VIKEACRFKIEGRVQGVYYRASAQEEAIRLGLTGWVRNLPDGAVETVACGTIAQLAAFEDWLWRGPRRAKVTQVIVEVYAIEESEGFHVLG